MTLWKAAWARWPGIRAYFAAVFLVGFWTVLLRALWGNSRSVPGELYTYLLVVSAIALIGSLPQAIFTVFLSLLAADLWVLPGALRFHLDLEHAFRVLVFAAVGITESTIQSRLVEARQKIRSQYEVEHQVAQTLQGALLPSPTSIPGYESAFLYEPASRIPNVGGDFLDVFPIDDSRVGLLLGDVTGHGIEAAVATAEVRYTLKAYALQGSRPSECLCLVNNAICQDPMVNHLATIFFAVLDVQNHRLCYASAGHEPALFLRHSDRKSSELCIGGVPIGIARGTPADFPQHDLSFEPGATLLVYTDGVVEARSGDEFFGTERLKTAISALIHCSARDAVARLYCQVCEFASQDLRDDVALLWVHRPAGIIPNGANSNAIHPTIHPAIHPDVTNANGGSPNGTSVNDCIEIPTPVIMDNACPNRTSVNDSSPNGTSINRMSPNGKGPAATLP